MTAGVQALKQALWQPGPPDALRHSCSWGQLSQARPALACWEGHRVFGLSGARPGFARTHLPHMLHALRAGQQRRAERPESAGATLPALLKVLHYTKRAEDASGVPCRTA